jgi:hypothetical protein
MPLTLVTWSTLRALARAGRRSPAPSQDRQHICTMSSAGASALAVPNVLLIFQRLAPAHPGRRERVSVDPPRQSAEPDPR